MPAALSTQRAANSSDGLRRALGHRHRLLAPKRAEVDGFERSAARPTLPSLVELVAVDARGHDQHRRALSHSAGKLGQMRERRAVGPMHVLDDQQSRLFSARSLDDPGEGAPLTANSRCVVHRIVQGAQFPGLRNIEEIVEEDELFRLHEILGQRRGGGRARALGVTGRIQIQQTSDERTNGIAFHAGAKSSTSPAWQPKPAALAAL